VRIHVIRAIRVLSRFIFKFKNEHLVGRIIGEEKMLVEELESYE